MDAQTTNFELVRRCVQHALPDQLLNATIEMRRNEHLRSTVIQLTHQILAKKFDPVEVVQEVVSPANWWSHFRFDVFPAWFNRRWPPKTKTTRQVRRFRPVLHASPRIAFNPNEEAFEVRHVAPIGAVLREWRDAGGDFWPVIEEVT